MLNAFLLEEIEKFDLNDFSSVINRVEFWQQEAKKHQKNNDLVMFETCMARSEFWLKVGKEIIGGL
jgi:hypothetical protein